MSVTTQQETIRALGPVASGLDEEVKRRAYLAAEAYVLRRCTWPTLGLDGVTVLPAPDSLVQAVQLLTARYLERRNSPSGVLGSGDFGVVRVSSSDRDVSALIAPYRRMLVG